MKNILKSLFVILCVMVLPFALASCNFPDYFNSTDEQDVQLETGLYFVSSYKINGSEYPAISGKNMTVTKETLTFGNGQMSYYIISGTSMIMTNAIDVGLTGTITNDNGIYTVNLSGGATISFTFRGV